jgi:hypothetical protein
MSGDKYLTDLEGVLGRRVALLSRSGGAVGLLVARLGGLRL